MTGLPLRMIDRNLLIGYGCARAALYRLDCVSYPFLSVADKRAWLRRLARLAHGLEADFSLYRVCRAYPAEAYAAQAAGMLDARRQDPEAWRELLAGHESHLRRLRSWLPEVYLSVSLEPASRWSLGASAIGGLIRARRRLEELLGIAGALIPESEIDALALEEQRVYGRVTACVPAHRATAAELQWLLRRSACRGVREPRLDRHWQPSALRIEAPDGRAAFRPLQSDLVRHVNAPITEEERCLVVDADEARTYQAMLAVGALPEQSVFPGTAEILFSALEGVAFPADCVLHVRRLDNREALTRVRRRIVDADNAHHEQLTSAHGPLSYVVEENRALARELDAYLQGTERPPLLNVAISVAVGAGEREQLERRVEELRASFGTVMLHRPLGLQAALYFDHLPRADAGVVRDYADVLTVEQFAALIPVGTHGAGSERGVLIGRTCSGGPRPIKFDITEASRAGRPPSILLAGTLGSGKTIAAQLLAYQAERRGSLVVDVDPKPDHNLEGLSELAGRVSVIELSGDDRYRGLLDPLVIAPEGLREDLASSYLTELLPQAPAGWETQIRKAVKAALATEAPSCVRVLELLAGSENPDARAAGEALAVWADSGIGRLAFNSGQHAHAAADLPVTTIKARGLSLPSPGVPRADYDQAERLGVIAVVVAVAGALGQATSGLGFLMAFGLQAVFFWAIFLYRKQITQRLVGATVGRPDAGPIRTAANRGATIAATPFAALTALPGRRGSDDSMRQESALAGDSPDSPAASPSSSGRDDRPPGSAASPAAPSSEPPPHPGHNGRRSAAAPSRNGRDPAHAAAVSRPTGAESNGAVAVADARAATTDALATGHDTPAAAGSAPEADGSRGPVADQDVMRSARELRDDQAHELRNHEREGRDDDR